MLRCRLLSVLCAILGLESNSVERKASTGFSPESDGPILPPCWILQHYHLYKVERCKLSKEASGMFVATSLLVGVEGWGGDTE